MNNNIFSPDSRLAALPTVRPPEAVGCNGDPHLVGFRGQKFDFTGEDGLWYALVSDGPCHLTNVRITAPVPGTSEITYITGVGLTLCDANEISHTVEITVKQPHVLETRCPEGAGSFACLADGALEVVLDGRKLTAPGQVTCLRLHQRLLRSVLRGTL